MTTAAQIHRAPYSLRGSCLSKSHSTLTIPHPKKVPVDLTIKITHKRVSKGPTPRDLT